MFVVREEAIHMRAKKTQYKAPMMGSGMEATTAPNFPVHGQEGAALVRMS